MTISYNAQRWCAFLSEYAISRSAKSKLPRMHFDIWALHLETMSPELQYEEERSPSWVAHMGWVSELQVGRKGLEFLVISPMDEWEKQERKPSP